MPDEIIDLGSVRFDAHVAMSRGHFDDRCIEISRSGWAKRVVSSALLLRNRPCQKKPQMCLESVLGMRGGCIWLHSKRMWVPCDDVDQLSHYSVVVQDLVSKKDCATSVPATQQIATLWWERPFKTTDPFDGVSLPDASAPALQRLLGLQGMFSVLVPFFMYVPVEAKSVTVSPMTFFEVKNNFV